MLVDYARSHEVLFDQVESKLKGDSRWEQVALGRAELEDIFRDHVDTLFDKAKKAFFTLVESVVGTKLTTTWEEVMRDHQEIKDDARYLRLSSNAPLRAEKGPQLFAEFSRTRVWLSAFAPLLEDSGGWTTYGCLSLGCSWSRPSGTTLSC